MRPRRRVGDVAHPGGDGQSGVIAFDLTRSLEANGFRRRSGLQFVDDFGGHIAPDRLISNNEFEPIFPSDGFDNSTHPGTVRFWP